MPQWLRITLLLFIALGIVGLIAYTFVRAFQKSADPVRLAVKWIVTLLCASGLFWFARGGGPFGTIYAVLLSVPMAIVLAFIWAPSIGHTLFSPILSALDGGSEEIEAAPLYSTAEGLRRRGKFRESVYAIQEQLQKFPADFTGQMMLAEIQAENLNDLPGAETAVHRLCAQPKHTPANLAFALNTLADWHLKFAQDAEAARAALEEIIRLLPGTEFERTAASRIAHLASTAQLVEARAPSAVKMKPGVEYLGLLKSQAHLLPKEKNFKMEAAELVAHLEAHPLDHEARERLATIYARDYERLDLATQELEQLIALPGESPKHVVRWLNLLADHQIHGTGQTQLAEATLQRIIEMYPDHSSAEMARQRLSTIHQELKRFEKTRVVKFGPE